MGALKNLFVGKLFVSLFLLCTIGMLLAQDRLLDPLGCCPVFDPMPPYTDIIPINNLVAGSANANRRVLSLDWSASIYGTSYVAIATAGGPAELQVYAFDPSATYPAQNGLIFIDSENLNRRSNIVRWHPTLPLLAIGSRGSGPYQTPEPQLLIYSFDGVSLTLEQEITFVGAGIDHEAVEGLDWDRSGEYLAVGVDIDKGGGPNIDNTELYVYQVDSESFLLTELVSTTIIDSELSENALGWNNSSDYIAIGFESNSNSRRVQVFKFTDNGYGATLETAGALDNSDVAGMMLSIDWSPVDQLFAVGTSSSPFLYIYRYTPDPYGTDPDNAVFTSLITSITNNSPEGLPDGIDDDVYEVHWSNLGACLLIGRKSDPGPETRIYHFNCSTGALIERGSGIPGRPGGADCRAARWSRDNKFVAYSNEQELFVWAVSELTGCEVDLAIEKSVSNQSPSEGQVIAYTLTVINNGPGPASTIFVNDLLPAGLSYITDTPSQGSYSAVSGIWEVGELADGASATLLISATVLDGTVGMMITNTASIADAYLEDPYLNNNSASVTIEVQEGPPPSWFLMWEIVADVSSGEITVG